MVKTQKVKVKKITLKDAKLKAAKMGLEVNSKYDKRCLNTWLYTIGEPNVIPVERKQLVHIAKKKVESLSMSELIALAETIK